MHYHILQKLLVKTNAPSGQDAENREDNVRIVQETVKNLGGLDIIIANAGWTKPSKFGDLHALTDAEWNKVECNGGQSWNRKISND